MTDAAAPHGVSTGVRVGLAAVRLWLLLLVLAGFVQLYFILQVGPYVDPGIAWMAAIYRLAILSVALRMMVLALALYFFTYHPGRASLYGLIAAIVFHTLLCEAITRMIQGWIGSGSMRIDLLPLLAQPEMIVNTVVIAWFLLSRQVNAIYDLNTREALASGIPELWNRLRGRAAANS
jgi:hypothetical protein